MYCPKVLVPPWVELLSERLPETKFPAKKVLKRTKSWAVERCIAMPASSSLEQRFTKFSPSSLHVLFMFRFQSCDHFQNFWPLFIQVTSLANRHQVAIPLALEKVVHIATIACYHCAIFVGCISGSSNRVSGSLASAGSVHGWSIFCNHHWYGKWMAQNHLGGSMNSQTRMMVDHPDRQSFDQGTFLRTVLGLSEGATTEGQRNADSSCELAMSTSQWSHLIDFPTVLQRSSQHQPIADCSRYSFYHCRTSKHRF